MGSIDYWYPKNGSRGAKFGKYGSLSTDYDNVSIFP